RARPAPLRRTPDAAPPAQQRQRAERPRVQPGRAAQRKQPKHRAAAPAGEPTDGPRQRAARALQANYKSLTRVAEIAGVGRSTVVNARRDLATEARKAARMQARQARATPKPATERRQRAQRFLKDALASGPKCASDIEEQAEKAHVDLTALTQARGDLGVVTSRGNAGAGNTLSVQWSLPG